ncbi:hypothetical protein HPB52_004827 [Rhipicephalus sanguineus]|uniref:DNA (cytosine-5-)-methyltransferase n=1 Tax=Rhipicephalus sanguineus TaxID=34632 RepID=A0A9D4SNR1_RHISA|nr:hypothetical protein HPB52_004827 [Rhipicephalus sanguineus]
MGSLVWAQLGRSRHWPAVVVDPKVCGRGPAAGDRLWVCWLAEYRVSEVPIQKVCSFVLSFKRCLSKLGGKRYLAAVDEAIKDKIDFKITQIIVARSCTSLPDGTDLVAWFLENFSALDVHVAGSGKYVLDQLGLSVEAYYASEVDKDAIHVGLTRHGSSITYLGPVEHLDDQKLQELCPIDLLIGGSPCSDLALVNPNRKGLYDPTGTGILFFEFYRVFRTVQQSNGGTHLFWMFENVVAMPREYRRIISRFLQVTKVRTVTTNPNSLRQTKHGVLPITMNGEEDVLWATELEELFGFPRHYTDVGNISLGKRRQLLGKAWSVPVVCHILRPLRSFFRHAQATA